MRQTSALNSLYLLTLLLLPNTAAWGQECPSSFTSSSLSCSSNSSNKSIYYMQNAGTSLSVSGTNATPTIIDPHKTIAPPLGGGVTGDGIQIRASGTVNVETLGNVQIYINQTDKDGIHVRGGGSWLSGYYPENINISLSSDTLIDAKGNESDGIVAAGSTFSGSGNNITINSHATIRTYDEQASGIITKYNAGTTTMNIGGAITTQGNNAPAIVSSPDGGRATSNITLNYATLKTQGNRSVGVVYNPKFWFWGGEEASASKTSTITANNSTITTAGNQAHAIAAAAGYATNTSNTVTLNNSTLSLSGADAHGVYLSTGRGNRATGSYKGQPTASVTMTNGSITSAADGIHFVDNGNNSNQGTTGTVTLAGTAMIDAKNNAIFTGRGTDTVTLKDNVRIEGMVDGGDDTDTPDGWIDRLIFENYNSSAQLGYKNLNQLVQYQNFEEVELINSHIQFTPNYSTPASISYKIDKNSTISKQATGDANHYKINANIINAGTISLQDATAGINGDTLEINGNLNNQGTINLQDGFVGDTMNITGDFVNADTGLLLVDTDFYNKTSDVFEIGGQLSGKGLIKVNDVTSYIYSPYADSPQGIAEALQAAAGDITIIKADNDTTPNDTELSIVISQRYNNDPQLGRFKKSPFVWNLKPSGTDWVLAYNTETRSLEPDRAPKDPADPAPKDPVPKDPASKVPAQKPELGPTPKPVVLAEISIYTSLPTIGWESANTELDRLHTRLGELRNKAGANTFSQDEEPKAAWARLYAKHFDYGGDRGFELDGYQTGINIGFDQHIGHDNDWTTYAGIFAGYHRGNYQTTGKGSQINSDTFGHATTHGWSLGGYATFFEESGSYVDLVLQYSRLKSNMQAAGLSAATRASAWAGSIEIGHSFSEEEDWVKKDWIIEPQAQLVFSRGKWKDFHDGFSSVRFDNHTAVTGRLGVRAEKTLQTEDGEAKPWLYLGLLHDFNAAAKVRYANIAFDSQSRDTLLEFKIGFTDNLDDNTQFYGDLGIATDFDDYQSISGHIGFRKFW